MLNLNKISLLLAAGLISLNAIAADVKAPSPKVEYSADQTMETEDMTMTGKVYVTPTKQRREMNMSGDTMTMIQRNDKKIAWTLMPAEQMYMEMSFNEAKQQSDNLDNYKIETTPMGTETVNGVSCEKSKIIIVPIDANQQYAGGFFNLLNPFALLGGLTTVALFTLHGAVFLGLKTSGELLAVVQGVARKLWLSMAGVTLLFLAWADVLVILPRVGLNPGAIALTAVITLLASGYFIRKNLSAWAFLMTSLSIVFALVTMFTTLFPNVMLSSLNLEWSLTIYNAASSVRTLQIMTVVALILVPLVLAYQVWSYWVFRKRVEEKPETLTY